MRMFVNGDWWDSTGGGVFEVNNPATGDAVDSVPSGGVDDVRSAVDFAEVASEKWALLLPRERGKILFKAAQRVRAEADQLAVLLTSEQGKPLFESKNEILGFANILEYYMALSASVSGESKQSGLSDFSFVIKEPVGTCGAIIPWNMPALIMGWKIGPALVAGNTMVLKPASSTPLTNLKLGGILGEAGLPPGVLNIVTGPGGVVGEEIAANSKIGHLSFTGDQVTGRRVAELTSKVMKPVTLELGGSDPMIVCEDADIERAVNGAVRGRFYNCGQTCTAVKRLFLDESIAVEFIRKIEIKVSSLKVGNGLLSGVDMGPMNNREQHDRICDLVDGVKSSGEGTVLAGGSVLSGSGYENGLFYEPTLVTDLPENSPLLKEEVFGPVLPVVITNGLEDAVCQANKTRYGLGASVWTDDVRKIKTACESVESGILWVNQHLRIPPDVPFGGVKESGMGRENGSRALEPYLREKTVLISV